MFQPFQWSNNSSGELSQGISQLLPNVLLTNLFLPHSHTWDAAGHGRKSFSSYFSLQVNSPGIQGKFQFVREKGSNLVAAKTPAGPLPMDTRTGITWDHLGTRPGSHMLGDSLFVLLQSYRISSTYSWSEESFVPPNPWKFAFINNLP